MKAAYFERFGAATEVLQIGEQPDPVAGDGEVLVRLHSSGVNPSDVKKRAGAFPDLLDDGLIIPHSDGAGVIAAAGPGVPAARVGERVWVYQAQHRRRGGTAAELLAIDQQRAVTLPDSASFDVGACLGIPAMTAHRCVYADGDVRGQTILITGGTGRVGHYAIQWAHQGGAKVIATASSAKGRADCLAAGASAAVDHSEAGWGSAVLEAADGQRIDRVVDQQFGANLPELLDTLRTGGIIATYASTQNPQPQLPFLRMMYMDLTIRFVIMYDMPESAKQVAIADINDALRRDRLQHRIRHTVALDDIVRAHELVETGGFSGCVVVHNVADADAT